MKKEYYQFYGIPMPKQVDIPNPELIEDNDPMYPILKAIYAPDPVTKLPSGDIMCYMASNTSPEIKQFILQNLQMDSSNVALPPVPDGIDEDTAFALTRQPNETLDTYRERVNNYAQMNIDLARRAVEQAKKQTESKKVVDVAE